MKHSDPGPMSDPGDCNVRSLCVDLCSLIAESRVPGLDERGYGAGVHCPPLIGPPRHACDLTQPECQKHQTIIHHLLEAAASNIFQIEVLLLPECCSESKLKERIENKDYILMERWSVNFIQGKVESNIDISQLLRAVRSFLHFSQLSAWLSSTNGKSPANICYWVNPDLETLCTKFKDEPEVHSFPLCKMNEDSYGTVKVEFPARTQYIPIVPCSKHPPICRHSLREINKDSNVCQSLSDSQMVRQLHKTSDTEQNTLATINYVPEPTILVLPPSSFLKTLTTATSDGSKAKRVLKHSNSQENLSNSTNLSIDTKSKNLEIIIPKKSSFVCNYAETLSLGISQENFCCNKRKLARHLRKTELKLKKLKKDSSPLDSEGSTPILPPDVYKLNQNVMKPPVQIMDVHQISNFLKAKNNASPLISMESSLVNIEHLLPNSLNKIKKLRNSPKAFKRKDSCQNEDNVDVLPNAKLSCDINISLQIPKDPSAITFRTSYPQCVESSQLKEKVKPLKEVHKEFIKHSSFAIPSYCSNDAKMLDMNYQQSSKYLSSTNSSDSLLTRKRPHLGNFENSRTNAELFDKLIISQIQKQSKVNVSIYNPELNLSKRKCTFQLDRQTNTKRKIKPCDEYNNSLNFHSDSTCNISEAYISEISQTCLNLDDSIMISSEKNVLNGKKLEKHDPTVQFSCSCRESNTICNNSNHILVNNASSSNIQTSSSSGKKNDCVMKSHIRKRKLFSRNYCKSSLPKNKSQNQKTNLRRSYRLLLASDQIPLDKSLEKPSNSNHEHATEMKYVPSCKSDCEIPCMLEAKLEDSSIASKEKLSKNTESVDVSIKQNLVIKVRKEKAVHKDLKLNKLFKFKKVYSQISSERKNSIASTIKQLPLHKIADSNHLVKVNTMNSSFHDCKGNFSSSNVNKLIINPLLQNDCSTTNLQNSYKASKGINMKNDSISTCQSESSMNALKMNTLQSDTQNSIPSFSFRNVYRGTNENFVKRTAKFSKSKNLLMNFEESILRGCLPVVNNVKGFHAEIGASGSFCPSHLTLPADVSFYELGHSNQGTFPYVAHVSLKNSEYYLPKKGAVQVTLFNPSETVVKMFVLNYDLSSMPPLCHTFIRQKTYFLPVGINKENPTSQRWLRFIIHLRFASSKTGRITLHEDFKIVVLNKTNDDAASEFSQEPRELCSFISVPMNPTFSAI
ncbi:hypothetical protein JTE90_018926 [Oedothorax gibbosus]|uniref:Atos-like conserved domain-containing protein n=1 Tax=Oedothorax gibbosus TaxID=931172 RepID=A0AAV6VX93_9ARAC|nr:hypothetical protein JTE90_018926 [Oedothorax gibbosus]